MGTEGTYLNIVKTIYDKPTGNILSGEKLKAFPLRSRIRQGCPLSPIISTIIQHSSGSPTAIREEKEKESRSVKKNKGLTV